MMKKARILLLLAAALCLLCACAPKAPSPEPAAEARPARKPKEATRPISTESYTLSAPKRTSWGT